MSTSTLALVGSTEEFRSFVQVAYASGAPMNIESIEMGSFDQMVVDNLLDMEPDLVVVGPSLSESDSLKLIESLARSAPHMSSVLIANPTPELWPMALRAGVRDIVRPVSGAASIRESFDHAIEAGRRLRGAPSPKPVTSNGSRVFTVVSPKGGSGKTTVAANLAVTIAKAHPDDVVLVDLDVQFGDVGYAFRLEPEYSLLNATAEGVTPTVLKGFLTPHPSRVLALAAPDRPEDADDIDSESAIRVVRDLGSMFSRIVVDTAAGLDERTLAVLEVTTDVILVTATDVPSVRAMVKELDILERLGVLENTQNHLVLNRADARVGLSANDIEETIGLTASLSIPSTRAIPTALNLGEPMVMSDSRSAVARGFAKFAEHIGAVPKSVESGRLWRGGR